MRIILTVLAAAALLAGCGRPTQSPDAPENNQGNVVSSDQLEPMDDNAGSITSTDDGVVVVSPPQYPSDEGEGYTPPPVDDTPPSEAPVVHTAVKGDTFWSLARKYYGDPKQWRRIQEANPSVKHNAISVGTKIIIPQD
ncbi:MAG: LysM peptidoglycan-binding domain-containing protein [Phycisphaerae bacterium]